MSTTMASALLRDPPLENASEGVSLTQAAIQIGVHYQTLRNWIMAGQVPITRFGPKGHIVRIHPDDVEAAKHPK